MIFQGQQLTVSRHTWTFMGAVALMLLVDFLPSPPLLKGGEQLIELTAAGKASLGILAFAVTLWVTETIPFPITALFVMWSLLGDGLN